MKQRIERRLTAIRLATALPGVASTSLTRNRAA
jgi:hypothetical protein